MPPSGNGAAATPHRPSGAPCADQPDAGRRVRARFTHTPVGELPAFPTSAELAEPVECAEGTVSAFAVHGAAGHGEPDRLMYGHAV